MLAKAEVSSDLSHKADRFAMVDVLGAAGMSAANRPEYMAIFRVKYMRDATEIAMAKRLFVRWCRAAMRNRKLDTAKASRVSVQALTAWVNDVCRHCDGVARLVIPGTPTLSDRICPHCGGTGKTPIRGEWKEVTHELHARADAAVAAIQAMLAGKLA